MGPQRSRWQSFPQRTAQCKYSTSDSSPGSQCCRVHIPAGLHSKRTTFPRRQHSKDNTRQQIEGAFQSHRVLRVSHCRPQRSRWQDFRTSLCSVEIFSSSFIIGQEQRHAPEHVRKQPNERCQVWALNDQGGKAFRTELLSANILQVTHHRAHNAAASTYLRASTAKGPPSPDVNIQKATHNKN